MPADLDLINNCDDNQLDVSLTEDINIAKSSVKNRSIKQDLNKRVDVVSRIAVDATVPC